MSYLRPVIYLNCCLSSVMDLHKDIPLTWGHLYIRLSFPHCVLLCLCYKSRGCWCEILFLGSLFCSVVCLLCRHHPVMRTESFSLMYSYTESRGNMPWLTQHSISSGNNVWLEFWPQISRVCRRKNSYFRQKIFLMFAAPPSSSLFWAVQGTLLLGYCKCTSLLSCSIFPPASFPQTSHSSWKKKKRCTIERFWW